MGRSGQVRGAGRHRGNLRRPERRLQHPLSGTDHRTWGEGQGREAVSGCHCLRGRASGRSILYYAGGYSDFSGGYLHEGGRKRRHLHNGCLYADSQVRNGTRCHSDGGCPCRSHGAEASGERSRLYLPRRSSGVCGERTDQRLFVSGAGRSRADAVHGKVVPPVIRAAGIFPCAGSGHH